MTNDHPIFLSYSIGDTPFALRLAADLKNMGFHLWMDRLDMKQGDSWPYVLEHVLSNCGAVLAVLTPEYAASGYCQQELAQAESTGRPIFPVVLIPLPDGSGLPAEAQLPIDFTDWLDDPAYMAHLQELAGLLSFRLVEQISPAPTREIQYVTSLIAQLEAQNAAAERSAGPLWVGHADDNAARPQPRFLDRWLTDGQFDVVSEPEDGAMLFKPLAARINSLAEVAARYPRFALIGPPGSGKTTILRHLALRTARIYLETPGAAPLPILLRFVDWQDGGGPEAFIRDNWPLQADPVGLLAQGKAALYLDGLSETGSIAAGSKIERLRAWLHADDGPQQAVITCHDDSYQRSLDLDLPTVQAVPWHESQVRAFIVEQVGEERAETILDRFLPDQGLRATYGLQQLFYHPLLLSVLVRMCEVMPDEHSSTSVGFLLEQMAMDLWEQQGAEIALSFDALASRLSELAFAAIEAGMPVYMPPDYARDLLGDERLLAPENTGQFLQVEDCGVRFTHHLIQQYFAALKMADLRLEDYLTPPIFDPSENRIGQRWDPVIVIMAGLAPFADAVIADVAEIDPFLAMECIASGMTITEYAHEHLIDDLLTSAYVTTGLGRVAAARLLPPAKQAEGIAILLQTMRDGAWDARWSATDALLEMNIPPSPGVLEILEDLDPNEQKAAANGLRRLGASVLPGLIGLLRDGSSPLRRGAAWALNEIGDRAAVPALVEALHDPDVEIISQAAIALGWIRDPESVFWLLRLLHHTSPEVREVSANVLSWIGAPAVDGMLDELPESSSELRQIVIEVLQNTRDRTVLDKLIAASYDKDVEVRSAAIEALGKVGGDVGLKRLIESLKDKAKSRWASWRIADSAAEALLASSIPEARAAVQRWREEGEYERDVEGMDDLLQEGAHLPVESDQPTGSDETEKSAGQAKARLVQMQATSQELPLADLNSRDWQRRRDAIISLRNESIRVALPHLMRALHDEDTYVRVAAVNTLGKFRTKGALRGLLTALSDEDYLVCDAAADVLKDIGRPAIPYLIKALAAPNVEVRGSAVEALGKIGDPETIPNLARCLTDTARPWLSDLRICDLAERALQAIDTVEAHRIVLAWRGETAPDAAAIIEEERERTRRAEAEARAAVQAEQAATLTTPEIAAPDESHILIGEPVNVDNPAPEPESAPPPIESGPSDILLELLSDLHHESWSVRQNAAKALREYAKLHKGLRDEPVLEQLIQALEDEDWVVRWAVAEALAWIGAPAAVPSLTRLLGDPSWIIRVAVIRAMMEIRDSSAAPDIVDALNDPKGLVREAAAEALGELGDEAVVEALLQVLHDPEDFVRMAAIQAAGKLRYSSTVPALCEILGESDINIRWTVIAALGEIGDPAAVSGLIECLSDTRGPTWEERCICDVAAEALEQIGTPEAQEAASRWRQEHGSTV